jgi:hypothetical protein
MAINSIARCVLSAIICVTVGPDRPVAAQPVPALATATHLKCAFTVVATSAWAKDGSTTAVVKPSDFTIEYKAIDIAGGSAEAVTPTGTLFITARFIVNSLHLLAIADSGPVYVTTVFNRPSHPGKYKAVHSRHELTDVSLPGYTSTPEQYVGECEIVD